MVTDSDNWDEADWKLFARLLRIERTQIVSHSCNITNDRKRYFAELKHPADLFLDPDTGIATGKMTGKSRAQYVMPEELLALVSAAAGRVVVVYQHIRARKTRHRLNDILTLLKDQNLPFSCCSYESGTVAMLFFSNERVRVSAVYEEFNDFLGARAACRICRWDHQQRA
jgi:hypothetical protein